MRIIPNLLTKLYYYRINNETNNEFHPTLDNHRRKRFYMEMKN